MGSLSRYRFMSSRRRALWRGVGLLFSWVVLAAPMPTVSADEALSLPVVERWTTYTRADGLPSNKVFAVRVDGDRVWAGTEEGLALFENGEWRAFGVEEGLPHPVVLALDVSPRTGDLWIATMGGLARYSAGRFDIFDQLNSGLSNDFVNDVECDPEEDVIWAATAMGLSRFDLATGAWEIFTHENTPMNEPWTYSVSVRDGLLYLGAWGAGVLEFDKALERWREYRDPDKEMEVDLLPDDGPVHDVTASVDYSEGILWQATYFGAARYDGRRWDTYFAEDSGLAGNFVIFVRANGRNAWFTTDEGISATDGERWVTYRRLSDGRGEILFYEGATLLSRRRTATAIGHNFVSGIDFQGEAVWVATDLGVSYGVATTSELTSRR